MTARMNRRLYGLLAKRLDEARLDDVRDPRDARGKRWQLSALLRAVLGGLLAGARSLADVETQSERLSRPLRRLLGVRRRVADTTLRDALCSLAPDELRKPLHALVRKAQRRKALVRRHWGVETSHQILDGPFAEDDRPWILQNPRGALVVAILRRTAYTLLTLFRSVTQRSDERRHVPWKRLMLDVLTAFLTTNDDQIRGLRFRPSS